MPKEYVINAKQSEFPKTKFSVNSTGAVHSRASRFFKIIFDGYFESACNMLDRQIKEYTKP